VRGLLSELEAKGGGKVKNSKGEIGGVASCLTFHSYSSAIFRGDVGGREQKKKGGGLDTIKSFCYAQPLELGSRSRGGKKFRVSTGELLPCMASSKVTDRLSLERFCRDTRKIRGGGA